MSWETKGGSGTVLVLAGRRVDAEGADPPRFPLDEVEAVRHRLLDLLIAERAATLVCSAACGADLLALDAAGELGVRRRIVLPFAKTRFRETSVVDRPGDWGALFDRTIADVEARSDLVVLPVSSDDEGAYQAANQTIIREAQSLETHGERVAVVVWEGKPRHSSDATEAFRVLAAQAKFSPRVVLTLPPKPI